LLHPNLHRNRWLSRIRTLASSRSRFGRLRFCPPPWMPPSRASSPKCCAPVASRPSQPRLHPLLRPRRLPSKGRENSRRCCRRRVMRRPSRPRPLLHRLHPPRRLRPQLLRVPASSRKCCGHRVWPIPLLRRCNRQRRRRRPRLRPRKPVSLLNYSRCRAAPLPPRRPDLNQHDLNPRDRNRCSNRRRSAPGFVRPRRRRKRTSLRGCSRKHPPRPRLLPTTIERVCSARRRVPSRSLFALRHPSISVPRRRLLHRRHPATALR